MAEQVRQVLDQARAAGQPAPGRPTLAKLTGASDYRVRVAMAELANDDQATEPEPTGASDEDAFGHRSDRRAPGGDAPIAVEPSVPGDVGDAARSRWARR